MDDFLDLALPKALDKRTGFCESLIQIDARVTEIIAALKEKGLQSPYLRNFVVARINPVRFIKGEMPPIDAALKKMSQSAEKFSAEKITPDDLPRTGAVAAGEPGDLISVDGADPAARAFHR